MTLATTLPLGFIAVVTILLGLSIGRLRRPAPTLRGLFNSIAVGVLVFLVWDLLTHAWAPIEPHSATCTPAPAAWPTR